MSLHGRDRLFLKAWGLGLSDPDFARCLAVAGIRPAVPDAGEGRNGNPEAYRLDWTWPGVAGGPARGLSARGLEAWQAAVVKALPAPERLLREWHALVREHGRLAFRIARYAPVVRQSRSREQLQAVDASVPWEQVAIMAQWLLLPDEVVGVHIEGGPDWTVMQALRFPLTVSALPHDPVAAHLGRLNDVQPAHWPFRHVPVATDAERHALLVFGQQLEGALAGLLQSPLRLKARLVLVNGHDAGRPGTAALLEALVSRLSASGIVLLAEPLPVTELADRVREACLQMMHDRPLDLVIRAVFGRAALLMAGAGLLQHWRMRAQMAELSDRLVRQPRGAIVKMSAQAMHQLGGGVPVPVGAAPGALTAEAGVLGQAIRRASVRHRYDGEAHEASAMTEAAQALRQEAAQAHAEQAAVRHLQQQSWVKSRNGRLRQIHNAYVVGEPVLLKVRIGSQQASGWQSGSHAFPNQELPPNEDSHRLTVLFHEPGQLDAPLQQDITLPRTGESTEALFDFVPRRAGAFLARIAVLHRNRVLQTAQLRAQVVSARNAAGRRRIALETEAEVRHDWSSLDGRRRFDLALVAGAPDADGTPRVTSVSGGKAWATDLTGVQQVAAEISTLLSAVAHNTLGHGQGLDAEDNPQLLLDLAFSGRELYAQLVLDQLAQNREGVLDVRSEQVGHIQLVQTRSDAVIPLEFVYDYELGTGAEASVCPQHREALVQGHCSPDCEGQRHPGRHVCPMGFWGLRKVIERHVQDVPQAADAGHPLVVLSEPTQARQKLHVQAGAVVGHSGRVAGGSLDGLLQELRAHLQGSVERVKDWGEWATAVQAHAPQLLVAFPHNTGSGSTRGLELGNSTIRTRGIRFYPVGAVEGAAAQGPWHVRRPGGDPPLVLLLGCDTAGSTEPFSSHVSAFRQAGAAVVVSTIATVLGAHAVEVGTRIVADLLEQVAASQGQPHLGELLRQAKCRALLASQPMALCVVAFGDADWRL